MRNSPHVLGLGALGAADPLVRRLEQLVLVPDVGRELQRLALVGALVGRDRARDVGREEERAAEDEELGNDEAPASVGAFGREQSERHVRQEAEPLAQADTRDQREPERGLEERGRAGEEDACDHDVEDRVEDERVLDAAREVDEDGHRREVDRDLRAREGGGPGHDAFGVEPPKLTWDQYVVECRPPHGDAFASAPPCDGQRERADQPAEHEPQPRELRRGKRERRKRAHRRRERVLRPVRRGRAEQRTHNRQQQVVEGQGPHHPPDRNRRHRHPERPPHHLDGGGDRNDGQPPQRDEPPGALDQLRRCGDHLWPVQLTSLTPTQRS